MSLFNLFGFLGHSHTSTPTATTPSTNPAFDDANATNLVGLWDFASGAPTSDTGLADGIAQNGHVHGANITGDRLVTDGSGDYFDVSGADAPFDLDVGTIAVQFTQDDHVGSSPDVIVNRGEFHDKSSEGWFGISVTKGGNVVIEHSPVGADATIQTATGFFNKGDTVKVTYSWDAATGATALIENVSTGATFTDTIATTGLTMDIGDNDDENFTFGAREDDDGTYDQFFNGSIDYVAIYNTDTINTPAGEGIVEGTDGNDLIDVNYNGDPDGDLIDNNDALIGNIGSNDDIVVAGGGDDTVLAGLGDDSVLAGSGDDSVEGGTGDDIIFGDSAETGPVEMVRESLEWDLQASSHGQDINGFTQDTGNVNVTFSVVQETGSAISEFSTEQQKVHSITDDGNGVDNNSSLQSTLTAQGEQADYQVSFDKPVENVSFRINDIDGDGVIKVTALDANGQPITVNLSGGSRLTLSDTDSVAGNDTADSNGGYLADTAPEYSLLVNIPGPVTSITIEHDQNGGNASGVNVTDMYFDAPVGVIGDTGEAGNDILLGDAGEDTIFGQGGNDTIDGGADNDLIYGDNGGNVAGQDASPVEINLANVRPGSETSGGGNSGAGDSVIYDDVATLTDGTEVSARLVLVSTTDSNLTVDLASSSDYEVLLGGGASVNGEEAEFRLEFFETVSGDPVAIDSSLVIADLDIRGGGEQFEISLDQLTGYGTPTDSSLDVSTDGTSVTAVGTENNTDPNDPDSQFAVTFEGQSSLNFTLTAGDTDAGFNFGNIDNGDFNITDVDNGTNASDDGDDVIDGGTGEDTIFGEGGDDTIDGGADDDLIFGDNGSANPGGSVVGSPSLMDIDNLSGGILTSNDGSVSAQVGLDDFSVVPAGTLNATSDVFYAERISGTDQATLSFDFQDDVQVQDVSFTLFDLNDGNGGGYGDWDDQVTIIALDENGQQVPVTFTGGNINVNGNTVESDSASSTAPLNGSNADNVEVSIQGPISSLQIIYENGPDNNVTGYLGVSDLSVTSVTPDDGGASGSGSNDDGDDVIDGEAGQDTIFGNGGDDLIDGGAGDDLIYGDNGEDLSTGDTFTGPRESFNWDLVSSQQADTTVVQDTGDVNVTYTRITDTGSHESDIDNSTNLNTAGIDSGSETIDTNSSLSSITNGDNNKGAFQWEFDEPVGNVDFNINDLDGGGFVTITAYGPDGVTEIPVQMIGGSEVDVVGNVATADGPYSDDNDPDTTVQVSIPGPVSRIVVEHEQDGTDNSGIHITDMYFDTGFVAGSDGTNGEGGDDTITGSEGADTMFGEGGDDTFIIDNATDGAGDIIDGGNGPDETTDTDVLDLRGAGPVTIDQADDANDDGATAGTVTFADGSTLTFEGIETILQDPDNTAPDAVDDPFTVSEDQDPNATVGNVLTNDDDGETPDDLTVSEVGGLPAGVGTPVSGSNGGQITIDEDGTVSFDPNGDFEGLAVGEETTTTVEYTVTDPDGAEDTATVTFTVTGVNDAPDAVNDTDETDEETPVTIDVLANDTDPDASDVLTITAATVPDAQGTVEIVEVDGRDQLVFTPAEDFFGDATISYSIEDSNGGTDTAEVVVTVNNVNDAPTATDDIVDIDEDTTVTIDLVGNDTDPDGDELTLDEVTLNDPSQGTIDIVDNKLVFTPAANLTGPVQLTYTVKDPDGLSDEGAVTINVGEVADPPVANDDAVTIDEDAAPVIIDVLDNDTDPDGDVLTITGATVDPAQGVVEIVQVDGRDQLQFTPAEDFNGDAVIDYSITDGDGTSSAQVNVTIDPVNDDPVAVDDIVTTDEDTPVTYDVVANDTDVDNIDLILDEVELADPSQGEVTIVDNKLVFTPAPNFNGPVTVTYTVSDGVGGSDEGEVTINVGAVNDAPIAVDDADETEEDTPITINLLDDDSDPDGDTISVISATVPEAQGSLGEVADDGTVVFTPAENFNGEATITYTISDGNGLTDTAEHVVTVTPLNDAPDAVDDDAGEVVVGNTIIITPLANDTDPDDDLLSLASAEVPTAQGEVELIGNNQIEFTPNPDFEGEATISYSIVDGNGGTDAAEITVFVRDGIVTGTDQGELIDENYMGDPGTDMVDNADNVFSTDPADEDDDIINAGGGNDTVFAGEGDDSVVAGDGDDEVNAGTGDDTVEGGIGNDTLQGAAGEDSIDGGEGDDSITGGGDNDTLTGGEGNDTLDGSAGDDSIDGGIGDDSIIGGDGNDTVDGGNGDNVIDTSGSNALLDDKNLDGYGFAPYGSPFGIPADNDENNDRDLVTTGSGNDSITTGDDADTISSGAGNDTINSGIDNDSVDGGAGGDLITTGEGADTVDGGDGDDTIYGGLGPNFFGVTDIPDDGSAPLGADPDTENGRDLIVGGNGNDLIFGEDDSDTLFGGADNDTIDGGIDDDIIFGGTGEDSLIGGQGNDVIVGGTGDDIIDGGIGTDSLFGGDDRDTFINVNAGDTVDGGEGGDDFDTLDLTGSAGPGQNINVVYDPLNGENGTVQYLDGGAVVGELTFTNIENVIPCFTPGTMIATAKGERRVEDLEVGDRIITRDNGIQAIRWTGAKEMSGTDFAANAHLKPILIQQGALGGGLPERDMMVSPQHRVLVANDKTALYFEEREVLVAAKFLTNLEGVDVVDVSSTTYIHIMFDQHEVVLSDGTWTESFQPGDQTLAGVGDASREEILEIFPELATREGIDGYTSARRALKKHEAILITK